MRNSVERSGGKKKKKNKNDTHTHTQKDILFVHNLSLSLYIKQRTIDSLSFFKVSHLNVVGLKWWNEAYLSLCIFLSESGNSNLFFFMCKYHFCYVVFNFHFSFKFFGQSFLRLKWYEIHNTEIWTAKNLKT